MTDRACDFCNEPGDVADWRDGTRMHVMPCWKAWHTGATDEFTTARVRRAVAKRDRRVARTDRTAA